MRNNSAKVWLRGCKPRVYKKRWSRVLFNGRYFTLKQYTDLIKKWKSKRVGDPIFNTLENRWETLKEIHFEWLHACIPGVKNGSQLEIFGTTFESSTYVFEPDGEKNRLSDEDWERFKKKWR